MYLDDLSNDDGTQIVNYLANHFSSVYINHKFVNTDPIALNLLASSIHSFNFPLSSCSIFISDTFESLNLFNNKLST